MKHMEYAVEVADAKYSKEQGYCLFWVFNQSSYHIRYIDDNWRICTLMHMR